MLILGFPDSLRFARWICTALSALSVYGREESRRSLPKRFMPLHSTVLLWDNLAQDGSRCKEGQDSKNDQQDKLSWRSSSFEVGRASRARLKAFWLQIVFLWKSLFEDFGYTKSHKGLKPFLKHIPECDFFFLWLKDNAENLSTSFLPPLNQFWHLTRKIYRLVWHVDFPPAPSRFYFIWCFDDFRSEVLEFKQDWQQFKSWGFC